ncbi:hypothetical protein BC751_0458 [Cecembia calidifontis]|jgi:hypothetical protein|uniref:Uncharacterized protein n=1 Tax=Cecembia calidifontis TaxID=1187080 RepID=A0A4Q7P4N7_9BACT|nr:hypothetical protein BC751_0458 [Cecembia calidifontis]
MGAVFLFCLIDIHLILFLTIFWLLILVTLVFFRSYFPFGRKRHRLIE